MLLVAMPEVLEQCTLGQEKAYANNRADFPVFPHLKLLELYPAMMSLINIVSNGPLILLLVSPLPGCFPVVFWLLSVAYPLTNRADLLE